MTEEYSHKLEIERTQYDRIATAYLEPNGLNSCGYDINKDTVIFTITESLRKRFVQFAKNKNHSRYWISQMFLPTNIKKYEVR